MPIGDLKISGDGRRGEDGKDGEGYEGHAREFGVIGIGIFFSSCLIVGLNGETATAPTNGGNAQTVHVLLERITDTKPDSHTLAVTVHKHYDPCTEPRSHSEVKDELRHELGTQGTILLSSCGGAGGRGGVGGNGQGGGHGRNGMNATAEMGGTNGGPGGNGGDAGDGTSGAHGGKAGNIKLLIKEEDLDLLVAMDPPQVKGGKGGKAGTNGVPGTGGQGGRGGAAWSS